MIRAGSCFFHRRAVFVCMFVCVFWRTPGIFFGPVSAFELFEERETAEDRTEENRSREQPATVLAFKHVPRGKELFRLEGHGSPVNAVCFSPDGRTVATASGGPGAHDNTVRLWDMETGLPLLVSEGDKAPVYSAAFFPDGRYIMAGGGGFLVRIWDIESGGEVETFSGRLTSVLSVAFSPDGRFRVLGSRDRTARIWEAADAR